MFARRTTLLLLVAMAAPAVLGRAPAPFKERPQPTDGWPGWRGPDRTGISRETGLLARWPKAGPRLLWKSADIGIGYSTPSVASGRIYLLGQRQDKEYLIALDASKAGRELWSAEIGPIRADVKAYPGPRSTPTVDGDRVYALGTAGALVCLSTAGKVVWRRHLVKDLVGAPGNWGYAESPLIDGDVLICTPGGARATLAALDKKTGAVIWKAALEKNNKAAYSSAIVAKVGAVRHYVQFLGGGVVGVSPGGKLLWSYDGVIGNFNCCTPVFHDGHVFVSAVGGKQGKVGGVLLKLTADKGSVTAAEVYRNTDLANQYGGVVCLGGCLYGTNNSALLCLDFKTGRTKWWNASVGKGAITAADGRLYVRGDRGLMALVEASPTAYSENGRFNPTTPGKSTARPHPVIIGGRLYLREQEALYCYDVKKP